MASYLKRLTAIAALFSFNVSAFDIHTHTAMTSEAVKKSVFGVTPNTSTALKKLGLFDRPELFGTGYIDIGATLNVRTSKSFEKDRMDDVRRLGGILDIPHELSLSGWIIRGAVREDDNTTETPVGHANGAGDEPGGVFNRVFGHFYDPQNDRALTVLGYVLGPRSPAWAVDSGATIPVSPINAVAGQNRYNIPSAREAMWRALTGKTWVGGTVGGDVPIVSSATDYPTLPERKDADRKAYWATTFRAVGDVMHLVQDLAQPQHTRNDAHGGVGCIPPNTGLLCLGGHDSFIEKYLKSRTLRESTFTLEEGFFEATSKVPYEIKANQLVYDTYPVPSFANYKDYFYTGTQTVNA